MLPLSRSLFALPALTTAAILAWAGTSASLAFDESDWSLRCWDAQEKRWKEHGLEKVTVTRKGDVTRITNTSGIHRHAHFVFPATPDGDFTFNVELRGGYELGFLNRDGKDEMLYVELEESDANEFETFRLSRTGTRIAIERNGRVVPLVHFRFDYGEDILITLAIKDGESAEIRSYSLTESG